MKEYKLIRPAEIESESMRIINSELDKSGIVISSSNLDVVRRVIHTTADFDYGENLRFTDNVVEKAIEALCSGSAMFITDTNMALSGISRAALTEVGAKAICYMAEEEIREKAKTEGTTRAYASMKRGGREYPDGIFVSGNAPTALIALSEMIREGLRPALVIGVPVGFVNVVESKEEVFEICKEKDIPAIVAFGRKGGSNVAASICNALLYSAAGTTDPEKRNW